MASIPLTIPIYQKDGQLTRHATEITSATPSTTRSESIQQMFKNPPENSHIITTASTIFHPQGGGQPSDTGQITSTDETVVFNVTCVRQENPAENSQIYHLGEYTESSKRHFRSPNTLENTPKTEPETKDLKTATATTQPPETEKEIKTKPENVHLTINTTDRQLYSRLHTAGHLLGLATRHYINSHPEFTSSSSSSSSSSTRPEIIDGKASHFPGMSSIEFLSPTIPNAHRAGIQRLTDEYVDADMPVQIHEWDEHEMRHVGGGNKVYLPENLRHEQSHNDTVNQELENVRNEKGADGNDTDAPISTRKKYRCVSIGDKGAYPCGGTHVLGTKECGKINVYKISRSKGVSKISYTVE